MWILLLITFSYAGFLLIKRRREKIITKWRDSLALNKHYSVYQNLYKSIDAFSISKQAKAKLNAIEYTYGEIDFESFIALLSLVKPNPSTVFYDLGSGAGKAVIACAMVFNVQKCCGIEIFSALHQTALAQQHRLKILPGYQEKANRIKFIEADMLTAKFKKASLVFINATTFLGETWDRLSKHVEQVSSGAIVITTSKPLNSASFLTFRNTEAKMSWGIVQVFIQKRI